MYYYDPPSREDEGKYVLGEIHDFPGERYIDNASGPIREQEDEESMYYYDPPSREGEGKYVSGEIHNFRGDRYILRVANASRPRVEIKYYKKEIYLYVPQRYTLRQRRNYYEKWLRKELNNELEILFPKWERIIGVKANEVRIRKMKTVWGSCNSEARRIWISLKLIEKQRVCLEYVIVHELIHFLEKRHNRRFKELLGAYMPQWKLYDEKLYEL